VCPLQRGKYIAVCESDDYWKDPRKLQTQVFWLEDDPKYVICFHDRAVLSEDGEVKTAVERNEWWRRDFSAVEFCTADATVPTLTRVYRKSALQKRQ